MEKGISQAKKDDIWVTKPKRQIHEYRGQQEAKKIQDEEFLVHVSRTSHSFSYLRRLMHEHICG